MPLVRNPRSREIEQLKLFETDAVSLPSGADNGGSVFNDPAFAQNKTLPIHRWVPWIAGFSREFVRGALGRYLGETGTVMDPFSGVGTTLVEATLRGHNAIGFEINPYAALACRAKVNAHRISVRAFSQSVFRFQEFCDKKIGTDYVPRSQPPKGFKTRTEFYSPQVLRKVLILQDFIESIEDPGLQDLFRLAFASTMVRYSNYSYEPSLGRRVSAGKEEIQDFPVAQTVLTKLAEMAEDIAEIQQGSSEACPDARIINDTFFKYHTYIKAESVDLIVTSPPYLNNYHYNRNTRPQLYWLGFATRPQDLKPLEHANFGKYWQTVRDQDSIDLEFDLPDSEITGQLEELRGLNSERGAYGGNGWANYAASYFNDCRRFAEGIQYVLEPGGTALVVIGNSILQGIQIPTDRHFGKIAESVGLALIQIDIPRETRVGNSIIQSDVRVAKAKKSHQLYEAIVELRKT